MPHCRQNFSSVSTFRPQFGHQLPIFPFVSWLCCVASVCAQCHRTRALDDAPYIVACLAELFKMRAQSSDLFRLSDDNHPDSHIKCPVHLLVGNVADSGESIKHRKNRPRSLSYLNRFSFGKDPRNVLEQSSPGDVRQPFYQTRFEQTVQRFEIAAMRLEQFFRNCAAEFFLVADSFVTGNFKEQLTRETIPVRMQANGWQTYQCVSGRNATAVYDLFTIGDSDNETRYVVFAVVVEAGHLRSLASD